MPSTCLLLTYRKSSKPKMSTLNLLFTSPRKSRLKPTKRQKTKLSRCERNCSNSTETQENGKNEAQGMCDYSNIRRTRRLGWSCEETKRSRSAPIITVWKTTLLLDIFDF